MQSSMWSFLQKKEGGDIEDIEKKISEAKKINKLKSSPKKKREVAVKEKKETKPKRKGSKKNKQEEEEEEEDEEEDQNNDEVEEDQNENKEIEEEINEEEEEEEEEEEPEEMELDENEKEKSKKKNKEKQESKSLSKKSIEKTKKSEKESKQSHLKRLKRKKMDDDDEEDENKDDDDDNLDNLLDEKDSRSSKKDKEKKEKELKEKEMKEKELKEKELKEKELKEKELKEKELKEKELKEKELKEKELKEKELKEKEKKEKEKKEKEKKEKELKEKEKEKEKKENEEKEKKDKEEKEKKDKEEKEKNEKKEKELKEKEEKEEEKELSSPKKQTIDISDLFKRANAEAKSSVPTSTSKNSKTNKKQKVDHKPTTATKSSTTVEVKQTTTTTSTFSSSKSISSPTKKEEKELITLKQHVETTKIQVKEKEKEKEEEKEKEKEKDEEDEDEEEEEEYEEDVDEEVEDIEGDEEYEEEEEISENENEKEEKTTQVKSKFIKKVPISKKKGNAKTIQADLKVIGKYRPIEDAQWKKGEPVPYMILAKTFEMMESTTSRLIIIEHLTNLFRSIMLLSPKDLVMVIYLSINKIGPSYQSKELGIGEHVLIKSLAESTGRSVDVIKQELTEVGDLGIIAQNSRSTQTLMGKPTPLTIQSVFKTFQQIADLSGTGGQQKKKDLIKKLLVSCKDCETLYIIRSLQGKLRIGLAERSVLMALAKSVFVTPPVENGGQQILDIRKQMKQEEFEERYQSVVSKVTRAYSQLPNYDLFVPHLIAINGIDNILSTCSLKVGIPVKPMLAQPTTGISQMLDRFSDMEFTCEFKYDGERAQIHRLPDGTTHIYTRNLEDYTQKYPDIIANINKFIGPNVKSFILDCEAVAFDAATKKILSFQVLSTRARKSVQLSQIKVPVCVFAFDLLYLNGQSLIDEPLIKRREHLVENFIASDGVFAFAKYSNISDVNDIQSYLEEAVEGNCEGLMVKTLKEKSIYEPSRRSYNWLKIKKDYMQGMTDSLDLVPIGAWYGKGKRTGTYGAYLLACYDENNEEFQTLCKIGTGFSDEQLTNFTNDLKPHVINQPRNQFRIADSIKPDVWFSPTQVWEVLAADLSISPVHTAATGMLDPNKGIALRFPRFIRTRPDKSPEDATSSDQVVLMYQNQKINSQSSKLVEKDEDY
ncbi:hypothetical protein RB653_002048 [Dictyostelium firmibasis]|uniref:DNA ligase n=1 Tax=Dictyostelium firmibasis TaxID=79012 RepID=A0AAN7U2E7_9MYCE